MKIFTAAQVRACDAFTIKESGISSADLMERASGRCADWLVAHYPKDSLFVFLCGTGNNGGDGFAIARLLHQRGYGVKAFLLRFSKDIAPDCALNIQRLQAIDNDLVGFIEQDTFITDIPGQLVVVDAILGTGLSRPVQGWLATFITHLNQLPNRKVAIDMPSGLSADILPDRDAAIFAAHHTLSFQFYKRSFLHPESAAYTGKVHLLDIDLSNTFINATHTQYRTFDASSAATIYRRRDAWGHKGTFGHCLLVGGSYGKMGAISLASRAATRAGAGLVTALVPDIGYTIVQTAVPEVMCLTNGQYMLEHIHGWEHMDAIGVGPGMGTDAATAAAFAAFLETCRLPLVVDADALNIIAAQPELLASLPKGTIITPHPKEFVRLFGDNTNSMTRLDHARIQAMRYNINIVLKGHRTAVITTEGECSYNMTGNAGMATGGTGDVMTGLITGLLAQGYEPHEAAMLGVYLHGHAGDLAAADMSQEAMVASDVISNVGKAFLAIDK